MDRKFRLIWPGWLWNLKAQNSCRGQGSWACALGGYRRSWGAAGSPNVKVAMLPLWGEGSERPWGLKSFRLQWPSILAVTPCYFGYVAAMAFPWDRGCRAHCQQSAWLGPPSHPSGPSRPHSPGVLIPSSNPPLKNIASAFVSSKERPIKKGHLMGSGHTLPHASLRGCPLNSCHSHIPGPLH